MQTRSAGTAPCIGRSPSRATDPSRPGARAAPEPPAHDPRSEQRLIEEGVDMNYEALDGHPSLIAIVLSDRDAQALLELSAQAPTPSGAD